MIIRINTGSSRGPESSYHEGISEELDLPQGRTLHCEKLGLRPGR